MGIYAGIDCGTQSTKVVLIDTDKGIILGKGSAQYDLISNINGRREQQPQWWISAVKSALAAAIKHADINSRNIDAVSVSGQQHGLVILDKNGKPLYPAKLWCDTETDDENNIILEKIGGIKQCISQLGLSLATGYTASKILWIKKHYPKIWNNVHTILLPHNYINFWLTGISIMEFGDASGTGLFNIYSRKWNDDIIKMIDEEENVLKRSLPKVVEGNAKIGNIKAEIALLLNLRDDVIVASGSGDNMMAALGTGNIKSGIITMSLGTSGTIYAYSPQPISPPSELIANFCSADNAWLPLICTMNVTAVTALIQKFLNIDLSTFSHFLKLSPIGANGIIVMPFFNGERVPALPTAKANIYGLDYNNFTPENLCRAIVEGITFGLRYGLELLKEKGIEAKQIRLIGGGAKNIIWRQMVADIMNCEVICLSAETEAAALGAAIQAAVVHNDTINSQLDKKTLLTHLIHQFVLLDEKTLTIPHTKNVKKYSTIYLKYQELLAKNYLGS